MSETAKAKRRKRHFQVSVDVDVCDGCGICIFFCKPEVFQLSTELSRRGVYPAIPVDNDGCNNCRLCELACPQLAIAVEAVAGGGGEFPWQMCLRKSRWGSNSALRFRRRIRTTTR